MILLFRKKAAREEEEKKVTKTPFIASPLVPEPPLSPAPPDDIEENTEEKQLEMQKEENKTKIGNHKMRKL